MKALALQQSSLAQATHVSMVTFEPPIQAGVKRVSALGLVDHLYPSTWTVTFASNPNPQPLTSCPDLLAGLGTSVYFDIGFDAMGRRRYVSVADAIPVLVRQPPVAIRVLNEGQLPGVPKVYFARRKYGTNEYNDYTVVEDLSVGPNLILLANHDVLLRKYFGFSDDKDSGLVSFARHTALPDVLSNIALIVNCHQPYHSKEAYTVRPRAVICFPVHQMRKSNGRPMDNDPVTIYDRFNRAIWEALQSGSVVIHCLAGVHRAASVCVAHYLWRYHVLGHKHLPCNIAQIYVNLANIRRGVAPLSYIGLVQEYEQYLLFEAKEKKSVNGPTPPPQPSPASLGLSSASAFRGDIKQNPSGSGSFSSSSSSISSRASSTASDRSLPDTSPALPNPNKPSDRPHNRPNPYPNPNVVGSSELGSRPSPSANSSSAGPALTRARLTERPPELPRGHDGPALGSTGFSNSTMSLGSGLERGGQGSGNSNHTVSGSQVAGGAGDFRRRNNESNSKDLGIGVGAVYADSNARTV
jgi:hypothetical protein